MHFDLVDRVVEQTPERIVTLKHVTSAEEYLQDHFPGYPVMPGVLMLEAMVQAARRLCPSDRHPMVLGQVRALKYGAFVRPGGTLRVDVTLHRSNDDGSLDFKGEGALLEPGAAGEPPTAVSGRFLLRPIRRF